MNERATELAKRLVEHERWEWMRGMCIRRDGCKHATVIVELDYCKRPFAVGQGDSFYVRRINGEHRPSVELDLDDAATVGCLAEMAERMNIDWGGFFDGEHIATRILADWEWDGVLEGGGTPLEFRGEG